jgi:hypothetical protein
MTQALVARLGSKALDHNRTHDDPNLLNFTTMESWIACWTSFVLQSC